MKKSVLLQTITEKVSKMLKEGYSSLEMGVEISDDNQSIYLGVEPIIDTLLKLKGVTEDNVDDVATELFGIDPHENPDLYNVEFDYKNGRVLYNMLKPTPEGEAFLDVLFDVYEKKYR